MDLLIYGAGGLAKEVYDLVKRSSTRKYESIYFIDDFTCERPFYDSMTMHFDSALQKYKHERSNVEGIVAVGEPINREKLNLKFRESGIRLATLVDDTAIVSPSVSIGEGTIICEFVSVHANVSIGKGALIQPYCTIGHDIVIGDYSVMSSNCTPGGASTFGKRVYLGMGANTKEKIIVEDDAIIAMGAVVFSDVRAGVTVIGNPARITKGNDEHKVFN